MAENGKSSRVTGEVDHKKTHRSGQGNRRRWGFPKNGGKKPRSEKRKRRKTRHKGLVPSARRSEKRSKTSITNPSKKFAKKKRKPSGTEA